MKKRKYWLFFVAVLTIFVCAMLPNLCAYYLDKQTFGKIKDCKLASLNLSEKNELSTLEKVAFMQQFGSMISVYSAHYDKEEAEDKTKKELNDFFKTTGILTGKLENYQVKNQELFCYMDQKDTHRSLLIWEWILYDEEKGIWIYSKTDAYTNQILSWNVIFEKENKEKSWQIEHIIQCFAEYLNVKAVFYESASEKVRGKMSTSEGGEKAVYQEIYENVEYVKFIDGSEAYSMPVYWSSQSVCLNE